MEVSAKDDKQMLADRVYSREQQKLDLPITGTWLPQVGAFPGDVWQLHMHVLP